MNLKFLLETNSIYQLSQPTIDIEILKKLFRLRLTEVPIVNELSLLGFIQRKSIIEHAFIMKNGFGSIPDQYILKPDIKLYLNDTFDEIEHKIKCTKFKILPIYSEENKYIGSLQLNEVLKKIITEKDFIINQYECMFSGYGISK